MHLTVEVHIGGCCDERDDLYCLRPSQVSGEVTVRRDGSEYQVEITNAPWVLDADETELSEDSLIAEYERAEKRGEVAA